MADAFDRLAARVTPWADELHDPVTDLVWNPPGSLDDEGLPGRSVHQVPQSAWYALDLARRGEATLAARVVAAVLDLQYRAPGTPWHGTFARFAEVPEPGPGAREWEDYDPNWRQFVGIALQLLLQEHPGLLDADLRRRAEDAVRLAAEGEQASGRLAWHYTNIALQHAWLLVEAGLVDDGEELGRQVTDRWRLRKTFPEFNSPTYDGVDLWALALWRGRSSSERLREWGSELEAGLWRTIADRFHADLGNVAGPYGRAYGLDLRRYVGKVSLLVAGAAGLDAAPLPPLDRAVIAHGHDLLSLPALALTEPHASADAVGHLRAFRGERQVHDVITDRPTRREASAWLGDTIMVGAEHGDSDWLGWYQFVAGTVHWRRSDGTIGVLRYVPDGPPRGRAEPGLLRIEGPGRIEVHEPEPADVLHSTRRTAGDLGVDVLERGVTSFDGMTVRSVSDGDGFVLELEPTT